MDWTDGPSLPGEPLFGRTINPGSVDDRFRILEACRWSSNFRVIEQVALVFCWLRICRLVVGCSVRQSSEMEKRKKPDFSPSSTDVIFKHAVVVHLEFRRGE